MNVSDLLIMVVIAALLGMVVARILGLQRAGLLLTTFFGFLGVLLGRFLAYRLGLPEPVELKVRWSTTVFPLFWSVAGGVIAALAAAALTRKWRRGDRKKS